MSYLDELHRTLRRAHRAAVSALAWWIEGLWRGIPRSIRERAFDVPDEVLVRCTQAGVVVERRARRDSLQSEAVSHDRRPEVVASIPAAQLERDPNALTAALAGMSHSAHFTLIVPDDVRLTGSLSLPSAAEIDLDSVLYHELDRLIPFPIEECAFDYVVQGRDPRVGRLTVAFALIRKDAVNGYLRSTQAAGIAQVRVTATSEEGEELPIDLLQSTGRILLPRLKQAPKPAVLGMAVIAIAAALYLPVERYETLLENLEAETETKRALAVEARGALDAARAVSAGADYLEQRRRDYVRPLDVLAELTEVLPDHTWVSRASIGPEGLLIQGESGAPSTVLEVVESTELLQAAEFQSPVSRSQMPGKEQFSIIAAVGGAE